MVAATRDEQIHEMLRDGEKNMQGIGDHFGISRERVRQISERDNVKSTFFERKAEKRQDEKYDTALRIERREHINDQISRLRKDGLSFKEISNAIYGHEARWPAIQAKLQSWGQTTTRKDISDRNDEIMLLHAEGSTVKELCDHFEMKPGNVYRILRS